MLRNYPIQNDRFGDISRSMTSNSNKSNRKFSTKKLNPVKVIAHLRLVFVLGAIKMTMMISIGKLAVDHKIFSPVPQEISLALATTKFQVATFTSIQPIRGVLVIELNYSVPS